MLLGWVMCGAAVMSNEQMDSSPHKPAYLALYVFSDRWADSGEKSPMAFWDTLPHWDKARCRRIVDNLEAVSNEQEGAA